MLKTAYAQGRLTKDELEARAGQAFASRTYAELAALTADIPADLPTKPGRRKPGRHGVRCRMAVAQHARSDDGESGPQVGSLPARRGRPGGGRIPGR